MAGLVTEWIYDAFAGKYLISGKYLFTENTWLLETLVYGKYLFTKHYELTSFMLTF